MTPKSPSTLLTTALAFIDGYNKWDLDAILAPRAPDCTHRVYPARLARPTMNNTEYRAYFGGFVPYFHNFAVTVTDAYEDEQASRVAFQAASTASSVIGPYANEYVLMLKMTETQDKIVEIREFVDSEASAEFFSRLAAYIDGSGANL